MEINQVRFGNYTIGNPTQRNNQKDETTAQEEQQPQVAQEPSRSVSGDDLLSAMDMVSLQNRPQINSTGTKGVDPTEFLNEERIADIEAMMAEFESGVNAAAQVIGEEFPELSEANVNALAARFFAEA